MANLYVIKQKATADVLISIWCDFCNSEISKRKKELAGFEQEFKKNAQNVVGQAIDDSIKEKRTGCLFSLLLNFILAPLTGFLVVGSRREAAENAAPQGQAEKLLTVLNKHDLRNALKEIQNQKISIPPELLPGLREFEKKDSVLLYWERVQIVASLAKEQLLKMPDSAEKLASVFYFFLQKETSIDTKGMLTALFDAVLVLNIDIGRLPMYIDEHIAKGGYVDFSMKNYINEWMNTYKNTQKPA